MRNINNLQLKPSISKALKLITSFSQEPASTGGTTKGVVEILDAKYAKADLPAIVNEASEPIRKRVAALPFAQVWAIVWWHFGWMEPTVCLHPIKGRAKPFHDRPYPIPKIHKATLMKEIDQRVSIGVMKWQPYLQWASPSFIIPKKDLTVHTILDFRELNKRIVRNPTLYLKSVPRYRSLRASRMQLPWI